MVQQLNLYLAKFCFDLKTEGMSQFGNKCQIHMS